MGEWQDNCLLRKAWMYSSFRWLPWVSVGPNKEVVLVILPLPQGRANGLA